MTTKLYPQAIKEMAYAARFPGTKGYGGITVDTPEYAKDTAQEVAKWIRKGATIEHVSVNKAIAGMLKYVVWKRGQKE